MQKRYNKNEVGVERRCFELRAFNQDEGTFDAYVAKWNDIDSYGTRFKKGAFRKSIQERLKAGNIETLWQHAIKEPIGVVLGAKEDENGLLINGRLDVGVERADQARLQMASGTINQMSFGFDVIKQKRNPDDGAIDISEVKLWEVSPVTFGANENTSVENVRSEFEEVGDNGTLAGEELDNTNDEDPAEDQRGVDFDDTLEQMEMWRKGGLIMSALHGTIEDIWWSDLSPDDRISAMDVAWEKAHTAYLEWFADYSTRGFKPVQENTNALSDAFEKEYGDKTIEEVALNSPLSADELTSLRAGELINIEARTRLAEFSPVIMEAYKEVRGEAVTTLFQHLRDKSGFSLAEQGRIRVLIGSEEPTCKCCSGDNNDGLEDVLASLDNLGGVIQNKN